jgi:gamma-glutamylaminecyclotransferase
MSNSHNIFVYGTLRSGFHNNYLLMNAKLIGKGKTKTKMAMFISGIPYVNRSSPEYQIVGEVYSVDDSTLKRLDSLEGHPDWYKREPEPIIMDDGEEIIAELYLNDNSKNLAKSGDYENNIKRD